MVWKIAGRKLTSEMTDCPPLKGINTSRWRPVNHIKKSISEQTNRIISYIILLLLLLLSRTL